MGEKWLEQCEVCPCQYYEMMCAEFGVHCELAVEQCRLTPDLQRIIRAMIAGEAEGDPKLCPECGGTGRMKSVPSDMGDWVPCPRCNGKGAVYPLEKSPEWNRRCPTCGGIGEVIEDE